MWKKDQGCTAVLDVMSPATVGETPTDDCVPAYRDHTHDVEAGHDLAKPLLEEGADHCCDQVKTCATVSSRQQKYRICSLVGSRGLQAELQLCGSKIVASGLCA